MFHLTHCERRGKQIKIAHSCEKNFLKSTLYFVDSLLSRNFCQKSMRASKFPCCMADVWLILVTDLCLKFWFNNLLDLMQYIESYLGAVPCCFAFLFGLTAM